MRFLHKTAALLLCLIFALVLPGCDEPAPPESTALSTLPTLPPAEQYAQAKAAVEQAENRMLTYTQTRRRTVGQNIFSQTLTGTASYSLLDSPDMTAIVEDTIDYGSFRAAYVQSYCEKKAYAVVNGCYFVSGQSAQDFLRGQIPAVVLEESLYSSVTAQYGPDSTVLTFTQPAALENWVTSGTSAELLSASGTAVLDSSGSLVQTSYQASYRSGGVLYELEITVNVTLPKILDLSAKHPAHGMDCVELESLEAPRRLLQVVADVYTASDLTAYSRETVHSAALPFSYEKTSQYRLSGFGETLSADASYTVSVSDYRAQTSVRTQEDKFRDGVFTTRVNDEEEKIQSWVTAKILRQQYEDDILSALMAAKYLAGASMTEDNAACKLTFTGSDSFCQDMLAGLSEYLDINLNAQNQAWESLSASGYLYVSKTTGLPIKLGLSFHAVHTSDGVAYDLTHTLDLSLQFS